MRDSPKINTMTNFRIKGDKVSRDANRMTALVFTLFKFKSGVEIPVFISKSRTKIKNIIPKYLETKNVNFSLVVNQDENFGADWLYYNTHYCLAKDFTLYQNCNEFFLNTLHCFFCKSFTSDGIAQNSLAEYVLIILCGYNNYNN